MRVFLAAAVMDLLCEWSMARRGAGTRPMLFRRPGEADVEVDVYKHLAESGHASFLELRAFSFGHVMSWIVTPWCEAGSLQRFLRDGRRMGSNRQLLCFANQVRSGLDHLHRSIGFLHFM